MTQFKLSLSPNPYPGRIIAMTGIRGTGKTTLLQRLIGALAERGIEAIATKQHTQEFYSYPIFQSYMQETNLVRQGIVDITALTLISLGDTLQLLRTNIIPLLERGAWVLLDRYVIDQVAGFAVFSSEVDDFELIKTVANRLLRPDLAFLIDIDGALAIQRVLQRDGGQEGVVFDAAFYDLNNQYFLEFAQANDWRIIDGAASPDAIFELTLQAIEQRLIQPRAGPTADQ